jgi:major membrane immunogen (membrane-anchored lipoprotein)
MGTYFSGGIKMKKITMILAALLVLTVALTGCQPKAVETTTAPVATEAPTTVAAPTDKGEYVDGVYTASYDFSDFRGWRAYLVMTVENGNIVSALGDYKNDNTGALKTEDEAYGTRMAERTNITPKQAYEQLNAATVEAQSADIDVVTGATNSSDSFIKMLKVLVEQAKTGDTTEAIFEQNATYSAKGVADERGWIPEIAITFEGGKIVAVVYDEKNAEGASKSEDEAYNKRMKDASGVSAKEAFTLFNEGLVAKQDPSAVDVVTGATAGYDKFVEIATKALETRIPYKK